MVEMKLLLKSLQLSSLIHPRNRQDYGELQLLSKKPTCDDLLVMKV